MIRPGPDPRWRLAIALLAVTGLAGLAADDPSIRKHPVLGDYRLRQGFDVELVAREPLVFDPIDLEFDPSGDAWVLEMIGYPVVDEGAPAPGRIVRLSDSDGDGVFDRRLVFAQNLRYADSILPYFGGMLVVDPPDLLYLRDTDGDGQADLKQVLLSGFAVGPSESNFNGLAHGPDNWVYGANGSSGGAVYFPRRLENKTSIRGQDLRFRFRPEPDGSGRLGSGQMELAGRTGGGFGVTFDAWGRRYLTHEQRHIQANMIATRYLDRKHTWPAEVIEISDHGQGEGTRIYPLSTTVDRPNHPEQAGYFTAGCGLTHYGGGALGPELEGNFFVGEAVHNLVHRDVLDTSGLVPVARRVAGEERGEFLAARDPSFRAVNFATGPEGALYFVDMQRDVIEHPEWIPDEIEAELDLSAGSDRGRIYRIKRSDRALPQAQLDFSTDADLVEALSHPNQWRRMTAQRLLVEEAVKDPSRSSGIAELLRAQSSAQSPLAQFHRLSTLDGIGELGAGDVLSALEQKHPRLREAALSLAERFVTDSSPEREAFETRILELTRSSDPRLRFQAVLSAGLLPSSERRSLALVEIGGEIGVEITSTLDSQPRGDDEPTDFLETALLLAMAHSPADFIDPLAAGTANREISPRLIGGLAGLIAEDGVLEPIVRMLEATVALTPEERAPALEALAQKGPGPRAQRAIEDRMARRMERSLGRLSSAPEEILVRAKITNRYGLKVDPELPRSAARAVAVIRDSEHSPRERGRHLPLLEMLDDDVRIPILIGLLSIETPIELQLGAVDQLGEIESPDIGPALVERWRRLSPRVRSRASDLLLYRRSNHEVLLDALESGQIPLGEMNLHLERRRALLRWSAPEIGERAKRLFSDAGVDTRREAYERVLPATELAGNPQRGAEIFEELCSRCHHLAGIGTAVGPDLSDVFRKSAASLLHDIVDPNAHVSTEYIAFDVETRDGELLSGLLVSENDREIVLRSGEGVEHTLARHDIESLESSGLSLMPEELEVGLEPEDVASLLAFLQTPR